jgi:hypothetical protein
VLILLGNSFGAQATGGTTAATKWLIGLQPKTTRVAPNIPHRKPQTDGGNDGCATEDQQVLT